MQINGVVRKLDVLGRVVTPKEFRDEHNIMNGDPVEIFNTNLGILIRPCDYRQEAVESLEMFEEILERRKMSKVKREQLIDHIGELKKLLEEDEED